MSRFFSNRGINFQIAMGCVLSFQFEHDFIVAWSCNLANGNNLDKAGWFATLVKGYTSIRPLDYKEIETQLSTVQGCENRSYGDLIDRINGIAEINSLANVITALVDSGADTNMIMAAAKQVYDKACFVYGESGIIDDIKNYLAGV